MTREEIIAMAREAGLENYGPTPSAPYSYGIFVDCVERFVALVAKHEREACAQIIDANAAACANNSMLQDVLRGNAAAIRARGEKP